MTQQTLPEGTDSIIDGAAAADEPAGAGSFGATTGGSGIVEPAIGADPLDDAFDTPGTSGTSTGAAAGKPSIDDAKATIGDAKAKLGESAAGLKDQAADKAREYALMGKDRATEALHNVSKMIDDAAATVEEKVGPQYADYIRQASETVKGFAGTLEAKDVDELFEDGRELVRKSPGIAIGAAAAIGFALTRIVKAGLEPAGGAADTAATPTSSGTTKV